MERFCKEVYRPQILKGGKVTDNTIYDSLEKFSNGFDYMIELDSIRDRLNEAIKNSFEKDGRFVNKEVLKWQKKFDKELLKYYIGK